MNASRKRLVSSIAYLARHPVSSTRDIQFHPVNYLGKGRSATRRQISNDRPKNAAREVQKHLEQEREPAALQEDLATARRDHPDQRGTEFDFRECRSTACRARRFGTGKV